MRYLYLIVSVVAIFLSACTRPLGDKPSSMTIALPKEMRLKTGNATQAALAFLGHVVINVRGPGISVPISVNFDADKHDSGTPTSLPASFTLDVPAGSGRLIQIMAVYLDPTTKMGDFYYGDVTQDLVSGDNNIMIPVNLVGSGSVEGGRISGRYYLADGSTPSGIMEARYQPLGGKPAIVIERNSILNGWFSSFVLDSVPLDIVLVPSELKMFTSIKLSNFDSTTLIDNKKMKIILPDHYHSYEGGGGDNKRSETSVIGFFGDGVPSSAKVCYTEANRTFTKIFTDFNKTTAILWSANSTNPADVRAVKSSTVVTCAPGDITAAYSTVIPFRPILLDNWSGTEAVPGFIGAFQFSSDVMNGSSPVRVSYSSAGQYNVQFSVLPGTPGVADSVGVYYRASNYPRDYYGNGGGAPCSHILQGGLGFAKIAAVPLMVGTLDYNVNSPSPTDISDRTVMAFCPMRNGMAIGGGYVTDHLSYNPNSVPVPANSFSVNADLSIVGTGQCHKISLSLVNENSGGTSFNVTNSTTRLFGISDNTGNVSYFADEQKCISGTPTLTSVSISSTSDKGEVWYKDATSENVQFTFTSSSFTVAPIIRNFQVSFQNPGGATRLKIPYNNLKMGPNECRMIDVYGANGVDIPSPASTTVNIAKMDLSELGVADSSFEFYADCVSTTPISSVTFSGDFKKSFAIRSFSAGGERIIQLTAFSSTFNLYYNVSPTVDHLAIKINHGNPVYKGSCVPLYIEAQDSSNTKISAGFTFNMNFYPGGIGNFKNACGSATSSGTLATGAYSSLTFSPTAVQSGVRMEAQSVYQARMAPVNFDIKAAPPVERGNGTLKVHLMSDDLEPKTAQSTTSSWPILDPSIATVSPTLNSIENGSNPKRDGALFTPASFIDGSMSGVSASSEVMMTIKFKMDSLSTADILSLQTDGSDQFKIYVDDLSSGVFRIKGSGGWVGPNVVPGTWYTVSYSRTGAGGTTAYVDGVASGGGSGANPTGSFFNNFKVGNGFLGAVKAVIIDAGAGASSIDITSAGGDHQYIQGRVPNN